MAFIAPTTTLNTAMVPTTMGAVPMSIPRGVIPYGHPAPMGDLTGLHSSIGGAVVNYYNATALANAPNADLQAALLAQQQAQQNQQTELLIGAGIAVAGVLIVMRMRKKKQK